MLQEHQRFWLATFIKNKNKTDIQAYIPTVLNEFVINSCFVIINRNGTVYNT